MDEIAANKHTLLRSWGYVPIGIPAVDVVQLQYTMRWSLLPAYIVDGFLKDLLIIKGSVIGELFLE